MRCGRRIRELSLIGVICSSSAAWIRKAEVSANGVAKLVEKADSESVDGQTLQGDEDTIWKLVNAASDASADLAPILDKIRTDDVVVDGSKTMSGDGTWVGEAENKVTSVDMAKVQAPTRIREKAYHPTKGGNANHSGYSPFVGVADLSFPSWTFVHPEVQPKGFRTAARRVFHGSPLIDADSNVYIQSTSGWIFSLTKDGTLRWSFDLNSEDPQNPSNMALLDGIAFVCTEDGVAWAIDLVAGLERWRKKIATHCSTDPFSITTASGVILIPCNPENGDEPDSMDGSAAICAVSEKDGSPKWTYSLSRYDSKGYNLAPSIVGDTVYFSELAGSSYAISLEDGKELWRHPGPQDATFSTASAVVGHDGRLYNAFNVGRGANLKGTLRSLDLQYGDIVWSRSFPEGLNAAPAVGPVGPKNQTVVIVALGSNPECLPEPVIGTRKHTEVLALDAESGETLWAFTAPEYSLSCAGNTPTEICCPSMWSQPTLALDGRVYVNWSGGKLFALLDANGDGIIDANNPSEFSFYHHGKGSNSQTAMAPGLMVAAVCNQVLGYLD